MAEARASVQALLPQLALSLALAQLSRHASLHTVVQTALYLRQLQMQHGIEER